MKEEVSFHAIYPFRMLKSLQVKIVLTNLSLPLWHITTFLGGCAFDCSVLGGCAFGGRAYEVCAIDGSAYNGSAYDGSAFRRLCFWEAAFLIASF